MDELDFAGFFDGEVSLHRLRNKSTVHLRIDNTSKEALLKTRDFLGRDTTSNRGRQKSHHKDRYRLTVSDHIDVARILGLLMPYRIVKRERAIEMLEYINGRTWRLRRRKSQIRYLGDAPARG